ncbi:MAG TPA: DUF308 domain-containing protein [Gaiellaceae bacterium]|nr:DUF308 domain-containing protein [Gaiellaceae bacterium]
MRHRLLYGDWTWAVRDPLDVLRIAFFAGTIAYALLGRSTAVGLTAASALLVVVRIVNLPRWFDFSVIAAMTLIAWGTALSLYGEHHFYDDIVHSLSPFFYAPVLYLALVRLGVLADPEKTTAAYNRVGVFVTTLALGMAVGAGYEVVEWLSDTLLGTHLVESVGDTGSDLLEDTCGSLAGAALVTVWSIRNWSTRRRAPESAPPPPPGAWLRRTRVAVRSSFVGGWRSRAESLPAGLNGAVGLAAGVLILVWPSPTLRTVEVVFALAMLAHAALDLVDELRGREERRLSVLALEVAIAVLLLSWSSISRELLLRAIGVSAILIGLLEAAALSTSHVQERERWLAGAASAAAFVFGVAFLAFPDRGFRAVTSVVGIYLVTVGGLRVVRVLERQVARRRAPV